MFFEYAGSAKNALDLFCGIGPFALRLAERTPRHGDGQQTRMLIDALAKAAQATPGLKPVAASKRDLFRRPMTFQELSGFDVIVFDPPRQGAEAQAREIAKSKVRNIISVSCNAATFARDAAILIEGGYTPAQRDAGGSVQIHGACRDCRAFYAVYISTSVRPRESGDPASTSLAFGIPLSRE